MLSELLFYLMGILATVGGILLLERIVAGPHSTAGTGYAHVDSAFDFDRLRRKQYGLRAHSVLHRGRRSTLPLLQQVTREPRQLREAGEQFIPVASIVGSVDGASQLFDRDFRPVSDRARARLSSILVAMRQGEPLPPIEVWQWRGEYYVLDGHHRVAAARALGIDYISARVIEVVELSRYDANADGLTVGVRRRDPASTDCGGRGSASPGVLRPQAGLGLAGTRRKQTPQPSTGTSSSLRDRVAGLARSRKPRWLPRAAPVGVGVSQPGRPAAP